jgi:hypothetical protein
LNEGSNPSQTMKKFLLLFSFFICLSSFAKEVPDTVYTGIYITSVHDIDFKEKQYTINLWLWLKYKNPAFDFSKYLEVPMAKTFEKSYYNADTLEDGSIYMLMKLQCIMKDSWKIKSFPFDKQKLRFSIENSQYDASTLVFAEDTVGEHYSKWTTTGWNIITDSFRISSGTKKYETAFGDPEAIGAKSEFSAFKMQILIERDSWGIFLKLFIGMYISFLLSFLCFFIPNENIESRFSLSVGSLFAVIGNKYVIDSSLPESTSFTLVDSLHGLTLVFVFIVVACSVYSLKLIKESKKEKALLFDKVMGTLLLLSYIFSNLYLIYQATLPV